MDQPSRQAKFLKEKRLSMGISLQAVHEGTKIPLDVLKAIEEGYKIRTLSPFYYKGFIKMYAHYLGVDLPPASEAPETIPPIETLPLEEKKEVPQAKPEDKTQANPNPIYRTSIKNLQKRSEAADKKELMVKIVVGAVTVFVVGLLLFKLVGFLVKKVPFRRSETVKVQKNIREQAGKVKKDKTQKTNPQKAPTPMRKESVPVSLPNPKSVETSEFPALSPPSNLPITALATTSSTKAAKKIVLTVRAKKGTWLQVKEDNAVVFQSTLKKGVTETWIANQSIEISGRNINQLEFELNGKMLGALGREDRLANKIVVTKDGLSVKK